jgi:hypothetical protein
VAGIRATPLLPLPPTQNGVAATDPETHNAVVSEPALPAPPARPGNSTPLILGAVALGVVVLAVLLGLSLRTSTPDRTGTPDELASAFAHAFPSVVPPAGAAPQDRDIEEYLLDRPATAHLIPGTPAEQRLDPATAPPGRRGFRDGFARAWIDDQGDHVLAQVYRCTSVTQAQDLAAALTASFRTALRTAPAELTGYDRGAALIGTQKAKTGLITTVGIGQVGDLTTVIVADQPAPARIETVEDLLATERSDL